MKVLFDFSTQQIAIEGDGPELVDLLKLVREIAPKLPSIHITTQAVASEPGMTRPSTNGAAHNDTTVPTMRQFVRGLALSNTAERITAVAYYQNKIAKRESFAPKEIGNWFVQCGLQKPTQLSVAVFDTKRKYGYIESIGRGAWRVSTQGENLIIGKIEDHRTQE